MGAGYALTKCKASNTGPTGSPLLFGSCLRAHQVGGLQSVTHSPRVTSVGVGRSLHTCSLVLRLQNWLHTRNIGGLKSGRLQSHSAGQTSSSSRCCTARDRQSEGLQPGPRERVAPHQFGSVQFLGLKSLSHQIGGLQSGGPQSRPTVL